MVRVVCVVRLKSVSDMEEGSCMIWGTTKEVVGKDVGVLFRIVSVRIVRMGIVVVVSRFCV